MPFTMTSVQGLVLLVYKKSHTKSTPKICILNISSPTACLYIWSYSLPLLHGATRSIKESQKGLQMMRSLFLCEAGIIRIVALSMGPFTHAAGKSASGSNVWSTPSCLLPCHTCTLDPVTLYFPDWAPLAPTRSKFPWLGAPSDNGTPSCGGAPHPPTAGRPRLLWSTSHEEAHTFLGLGDCSRALRLLGPRVLSCQVWESPQLRAS